MRLSTAVALTVVAGFAEAYPDTLFARDLDATALGHLAARAVTDSNTTQSITTFDAGQQLVNVGGSHAWQAPGPGDERGPCPGLNALANHGYLPRNGSASVLDLIYATTTVFGMGVDLAITLSVYGAVFDGNGLGWSIGGGNHTGIGGSHGNYETDNSPMRGDLHQYGSSNDLVVNQFQRFFDLQPDPATANYNLDVLGEFRVSRFQESIEKNPWFYFAPFAGTIVSQAAYLFIYRFMANHTAESPEGILDQDVLKSFFSISGASGAFEWTPGHERIPENWYRRSLLDPYGAIPLTLDAGGFQKLDPRILQPGCNTGTVNSYTAIQTSTNGSQYEPSNPISDICFALAAIEAPGQGGYEGYAMILTLPLQNALGCNTTAIGQSTAKACPGYAVYGGPTGQVAPGAIQS